MVHLLLCHSCLLKLHMPQDPEADWPSQTPCRACERTGKVVCKTETAFIWHAEGAEQTAPEILPVPKKAAPANLVTSWGPRGGAQTHAQPASSGLVASGTTSLVHSAGTSFNRLLMHAAQVVLAPYTYPADRTGNKQYKQRRNQTALFRLLCCCLWYTSSDIREMQE